MEATFSGPNFPIFSMFSSESSSSGTLRTLPSAEWRLPAARRISRTNLSAGTRMGGSEDFWFIVTPTGVKMSQKSSTPPTLVPAEKLVRDIRRATRKHRSAEDKIRIVLDGRGF